MENIFLEVLNLSITASWLVFAVLVMRLVLTKTPKWINCLMWLIVGIRLVCPFSIESALSLIPSAETIPTTIITMDTPEISSGIKAVDNFVNPVITQNFSPEPYESVNPLQIITFIASIVWIIGIILMLSYMIISYIRLKAKLRTATILQDNLYQSEFIKSPFIIGIINPKIYIPYNVEPENFGSIILHEKAHLKRHDNIIKPVAFLILSVYWFNPVMWLAYVFLCKDIELACDEKVVKTMTKEEKQAYAKVLLENSTKDFSVVACPFSFGGGSIKSRIKKIMHHKKPAIWVIVCSFVLCVGIVVCFMTVPDKVTLKHNTIQWEYNPDSDKLTDNVLQIELDFDKEFSTIECISRYGNFLDWSNGDTEFVVDNYHFYDEGDMILWQPRIFENETELTSYIEFRILNSYKNNKIIRSGVINITGELKDDKWIIEATLEGTDLTLYKPDKVNHFVVKSSDKPDKYIKFFSKANYTDFYVGPLADEESFDLDEDGIEERCEIRRGNSYNNFTFDIFVIKDDVCDTYQNYSLYHTEEETSVSGLWCELKLLREYNLSDEDELRIKAKSYYENSTYNVIYYDLTYDDSNDFKNKLHLSPTDYVSESKTPHTLSYDNSGFGSYSYVDWWYDSEDTPCAQNIEIGFEYKKIECEITNGYLYKDNSYSKVKKKMVYTNQQLIHYNIGYRGDAELVMKIYITDDIVYNATIKLTYIGEYDTGERATGDPETYGMYKAEVISSDGIYLTSPVVPSYSDFITDDHHARLVIKDDTEKGEKVIPYPDNN